MLGKHIFCKFLIRKVQVEGQGLEASGLRELGKWERCHAGELAGRVQRECITQAPQG